MAVLQEKITKGRISAGAEVKKAGGVGKESVDSGSCFFRGAAGGEQRPASVSLIFADILQIITELKKKAKTEIKQNFLFRHFEIDKKPVYEDGQAAFIYGNIHNIPFGKKQGCIGLFLTDFLRLQHEKKALADIFSRGFTIRGDRLRTGVHGENICQKLGGFFFMEGQRGDGKAAYFMMYEEIKMLFLL